MSDVCKAWRTEAWGTVLFVFADMHLDAIRTTARWGAVSLVFADTRNEAIRATVRDARAVGLRVVWRNVRAVRAPFRDGPQAEFQRGKCLEWCEP